MTSLVRLDDLARERVGAADEYFAAEAERIARLCHRAAERFARGGRLVAFGRHGGPEILDSELARLAHLAALTASIEENR